MNIIDELAQNRKSKSYQKVSQSKYFQLVQLVFQSSWKIKDASTFLELNYATAKNLIMKYRRTQILKTIKFQSDKRCNYKMINGQYSNVKIKCTQGGKRILSIKKQKQ